MRTRALSATGRKRALSPHVLPVTRSGAQPPPTRPQSPAQTPRVPSLLRCCAPREPPPLPLALATPEPRATQAGTHRVVLVAPRRGVQVQGPRQHQAELVVSLHGIVRKYHKRERVLSCWRLHTCGVYNHTGATSVSVLRLSCCGEAPTPCCCLACSGNRSVLMSMWRSIS